MKKRFFFLFLTMLSVLCGYSQITLYPYAAGQLCDNNPAAAGVLETKLRSIISKAGMVVGDVQGRFVLTANVQVLQRELTATAPQQHVVNLLLTLAVGDGYTGTCFSSTSMETKGVGTSEERALLSAIKTLKPASPDIASMLRDAQGRIIAYYNQNGPSIIKNAKGLIAAHKWDEACAQLYAIPMGCSCYDEACELMTSAMKSYVNYNSAQAVADAEAMWAANPTSDNAEAVMQILGDVATDSPAYSKAQALKNKVEKKVSAQYAQERQDRINAEIRAHNLESQRIAENGKTRRAVANAAAQVAKAYYNSHKVTYHVHSWW